MYKSPSEFHARSGPRSNTVNGGAYHTCDETRPPTAAHLLLTVQLYPGEPCRFSPKFASNHHSNYLLSYFINTFTYHTRRRQGSKTNSFPVPSSRCPRRPLAQFCHVNESAWNTCQSRSIPPDLLLILFQMPATLSNDLGLSVAKGAG